MDINDVIKNLKEDYALRNSLKRKNLNVQEELEDEIDDLEQSYITSYVIPKLETHANELLKDLECEAHLSIQKDSNGQVHVSDEYNLCDFGSNEGNEDIEPSDDNSVASELGESTKKVSRAGSVGFSVKFKDGTIIRHHEAKDTFIESLRKIGLERVSSFRGRLFKGYPLVGKIKRTDGTHRWQEKVGDWYIYVNISNDTKIRLLKMLSNELHLGLIIEREIESPLSLNTISSEIKTDKVKRPYNPEAELVVEFPDGTIYDDKKAIWTFVRAIEKIGFEEVAKVGIEIQGYNLVDKRQRTDKGRTWQKRVGTYYVYSYLSNGDKIKYLNRISTYYSLDLKIVAQ